LELYQAGLDKAWESVGKETACTSETFIRIAKRSLSNPV
jgi:hypothetical protein